MLTLGQAARLTGTSKTTLTRAIKAGRLSASRREDGGYRIDPAELSRVYEIKPETRQVTQRGAWCTARPLTLRRLPPLRLPTLR